MSQMKLVQKEEGKWFDENGNRVWRAGTLVYNKAGLVSLFFWLLIGSFTYMLFMTGLPMMLPIQFKTLGFNSSQIAWLLGLNYLGSMIIAPLIGMWSDRARTAWGRRRPFDLIATPVWLIGLILLPFVKSFWAVNIAMALVGFAGAATCVVFYLYNDVVPGELMGRFVGLIRFVGFGGALIFQYFVFPYFDEYPTGVWLVCAFIAFVFEMLMLIMVKEGQYPPPEARKSIVGHAKVFVKDGFGSKYTICLWLALGAIGLGTPAASYFILFFKSDALRMSTQQIGLMMGTGTALAMILAVPSGWIVDRFGADIVWSVGGVLVGISQILAFLLITDATTCWALYLIYYSVNMVLAAALMPMLFSHLPKEKFGQLTSFQSIISWGCIFVSNMVIGWVLSRFGDAYRISFLYGGIMYCLAPIFVILLQRCKNPFAHLERSMYPIGLREKTSESQVGTSVGNPKDANIPIQKKLISNVHHVML